MSQPEKSADPHWGKGGRYVVIDGQRVPAPAALPTGGAQADSQKPDQPQPEQTKSRKGK